MRSDGRVLTGTGALQRNKTDARDTEGMRRTVVEGDTAFLKSLDPDFVARNLVDDRFVTAALKRYSEWPGAGETPRRSRSWRS